MPFTTTDVLYRLDQAYNGFAVDYPELPIAFKRNVYFLQLEHIHEALAASRIHLFADEERWAVVFEKSFFHVQNLYIGLNLIYVGNCIDYRIIDTEFYKLIDNLHHHRILGEELDILTYEDEERYQQIRPDVTRIPVLNLPFQHDPYLCKQLGIPEPLDFTGLTRVIEALYPKALSATPGMLRTRIPADIPHLLTIEHFHHESYLKMIAPSRMETYQMVAQVLVNRDPSLWQHIDDLNNHWQNWESGNI